MQINLQPTLPTDLEQANAAKWETMPIALQSGMLRAASSGAGTVVAETATGKVFARQLNRVVYPFGARLADWPSTSRASSHSRSGIHRVHSAHREARVARSPGSNSPCALRRQRQSTLGVALDTHDQA